MVGER